MTDIIDNTEDAADSAVSTSAEVDTPAEETVVEEVKAVRKIKSKASEHNLEQRGNAVVTDGKYDEVFLDKCVFENIYARKSLTVHHLQRRLAELGHVDAMTDRDGWYGTITRDCVQAWQIQNNIEGDGLMNADTFTSIFQGDINVRVIINS